MNLNDFAREVTLKEGKLRSLPIAQVKEVIKLTLKELSRQSDEEIMKTMNKYRYG